MTTTRITRRAALRRMAAAGLAAPFAFRAHAGAAPSETVNHASFGANGQALADIKDLTKGKHLKLVAVADVDLSRVADLQNYLRDKKLPEVKVYQDWRELLDKEKGLDSVNVSVPDHSHAPITMRAMQQGLAVYTQKPLTQTIYEARQLAKTAADKKLVSQMGIQIHSHPIHKTVVALVQEGTIGKVKEVHSWSGKGWGDKNPRPDHSDPVPPNIDWQTWLGVAADRPFIKDYYHPAVWRKRLDFGTGTFGDMGCHILDPVFGSLALTAPTSVQSDGDGPNADSWALDAQVTFAFPATKLTTEGGVTLHWYHGDKRPPAEVQQLLGDQKLSYQGSIFIGTDGVLYTPYLDGDPVLLPADKFKDHKYLKASGDDHYLQFVEAVRGNGTTSAPFDFAGPLTESVLLGCLSTRFPKTKLQWNAADMKVTNVKEANAFVRKQYRKGWEVDGL